MFDYLELAVPYLNEVISRTPGQYKAKVLACLNAIHSRLLPMREFVSQKIQMNIRLLVDPRVCQIRVNELFVRVEINECSVQYKDNSITIHNFDSLKTNILWCRIFPWLIIEPVYRSVGYFEAVHHTSFITWEVTTRDISPYFYGETTVEWLDRPLIAE